MDLTKINNIASSTFLPTKKWEELNEGIYIITSIKKVNTKYGKRMVFEISNNNEKFEIFVPTKVSDDLYIDETLYNYLSAKANKLELSIHYYGDRKFEFM